MDRRKFKALAAWGGKVFVAVSIVVGAVAAVIVAIFCAVFYAIDAFGVSDGVRGFVFVVLVLSLIISGVFVLERLADDITNAVNRWGNRNDR